MSSIVELPIRASYRVDEGLLAGAYPGAPDAGGPVRASDHDVTVFVDLTHPADGLEPYDRLLDDGARRIAHPIVDMGTTTTPHMSRILDDVDTALAEGRTVYVHCLGGVGRTGTVVGCWLMRHSLDDGDPIRRIATLRRDLEFAWLSSPETSPQRAMVTEWKRGH